MKASVTKVLLRKNNKSNTIRITRSKEQINMVYIFTYFHMIHSYSTNQCLNIQQCKKTGKLMRKILSQHAQCCKIHRSGLRTPLGHWLCYCVRLLNCCMAGLKIEMIVAYTIYFNLYHALGPRTALVVLKHFPGLYPLL